MKRLLAAIGMVSLLSGCLYPPHYWEGGIHVGGYEGGVWHDGGGYHEGGDD